MTDKRRRGFEAAIQVLSPFYSQLTTLPWWKDGAMVSVLNGAIDPSAEGLEAYFLGVQKIVEILDKRDTDEVIELILAEIEAKKAAEVEE